MAYNLTEKQKERFHRKYLKSDGCWNWIGARSGNGYGMIHIQYSAHKAHRVAFELSSGPIPEGLLVRHSCDNKLCVNPAHLLSGTKQDNADDMTGRDRQAKGERSGPSKLTESEVLGMRSLFRIGMTNCALLSKIYGVSYGSVWPAVHGKTWKHLPLI